jgi:hypothetical protein
MVFDFGSSLIHDNRVLLFFHNDNLKLRADIRGSAKAYHFKILKEWTPLPRMHKPLATHQCQGCI